MKAAHVAAFAAGLLAGAIAGAALNRPREWYERGGVRRAVLREVVPCAWCEHANVQRHTGDDVLTCWYRQSHGEVVEPGHYCGHGKLKEARQ